MPTDYFRAKRLWNSGQRDIAFNVLRDAIAGQIGAAPFELPDYWLTGAPSAFESVVADLLTGTFINSARSFLLAPFGRVWAALWSLDRYDYWLQLLLEYNFFAEAEAIGFDEEEYAPPVNVEYDFNVVARAIQDSAKRGQLSLDERDRPNGGRPVLSLTMVEHVDDARWGSFKPKLKSVLANLPSPPAWSVRVSDDPESIIVDFLHNLFCRHGAKSAAVQPRWEAIGRVHPEYSDAVRASLAKVLPGMTSQVANEIAVFDAGRDVPDGLAWLNELAIALRTNDFSALS